MSFRKRSEVIGGNPLPVRGPQPPAVGRTPVLVPRGPVPGRGPPRGPPINNARIPATPSAAALPITRRAPVTEKVNDLESEQLRLLSAHPGVKPSILTSQPTVSTGSLDLDKILGHQGLPLGCSLFIEENGTTDFATVLAKKYALEGLIQTRLDTPNTHVILLGLDQSWGRTLPGLYKGSSRDQKKLKILENESKLSISNINDPGQQLLQKLKAAKDLKIAWRYGFLDKDKAGDLSSTDLSLTTHPDFIHQFDITSTLLPTPNPTEMSYIPISKLSVLVKQVESVINKHKDKLVRVVIPNLLHPMVYPLDLASPAEILKIVSGLKSLTRKYSKQVTMLSFLNLDLYPRGSALVTLIEKYFDCVLELKPFDPALYELMERVYQKEPKKIKQGFLNIHKLAVLSDLGMMLQKDLEYCFKNGKKNFDIEEWSIPVDEETVGNDSQDSHVGHDHGVEIGGDGNPLKGQTRKDIEF